MLRNKLKLSRFIPAFVLLSGMSATSMATGDSIKAPKLDPQAQQVIDQLQALGPKPLTEVTPAVARQQPTPGDAVKALLEKQGKSTAPEVVGNVDNRTIPGKAGEIPVRIYTPKGEGPFPVLVYYHGGGWVIANLDTYDASARALTNASNSIVVSSHYRQAPEHKFPAAVEDAYTAYKWTVANAGKINGDPARVSVAGESAGGNLAAVVSRKARDEKIQIPAHQLLIYPVTNYAFDTESYKEAANAKPLNAEMMKWFWGHYLKTPADGANPDASPLRAKDLKGLPPATIITAEADPLRSEGKAYADRLREAGVDVEYKNYDGMPHEFFGMTAVLEDSKDAVQLAGSDLQDAAGKRRDVRSADAPDAEEERNAQAPIAQDGDDLPADEMKNNLETDDQR